MKNIVNIFVSVIFLFAVFAASAAADDGKPLADISDDFEPVSVVRGPLFNFNQTMVRDISRLICSGDDAFLKDIQDLRREVLSFIGQ